MQNELYNLLKKRAEGFFYNEESTDYEMVGGEKYLLCKRGRLYFFDSFLRVKVKKIYGSQKLASIELNSPKHAFFNKKTIKNRFYKKKFVTKI